MRGYNPACRGIGAVAFKGGFHQRSKWITVSAAEKASSTKFLFVDTITA